MIRSSSGIKDMKVFQREDYDRMVSGQVPGEMQDVLLIPPGYDAVAADAFPPDMPYGCIRFGNEEPISFEHGFDQAMEDKSLRIESDGQVNIRLSPSSTIEVVEGDGIASQRAQNDKDFLDPNLERTRHTIQGAPDRTEAYKAVPGDEAKQFQHIVGMSGMVLYIGSETDDDKDGCVTNAELRDALDEFRTKFPSETICGIRIADGMTVDADLLSGLNREKGVEKDLFLHTEGQLTVLSRGEVSGPAELANSQLLNNCPNVRTYVAGGAQAPAYMLDGNKHVVREVLAPTVSGVGEGHARNAMNLRTIEGGQGLQHIGADAYATREVPTADKEPQWIADVNKNAKVPFDKGNLRMDISFTDLGGDFSALESIGDRAFANTVLKQDKVRLGARTKVGDWGLSNSGVTHVVSDNLDTFVDGDEQGHPSLGKGALSHNKDLVQCSLGWGLRRIDDYLLADSGNPKNPLGSYGTDHFCEPNSVTEHGADCYSQTKAKHLQFSTNMGNFAQSVGILWTSIQTITVPEAAAYTLVVGLIGCKMLVNLLLKLASLAMGTPKGPVVTKAPRRFGRDKKSKASGRGEDGNEPAPSPGGLPEKYVFHPSNGPIDFDDVKLPENIIVLDKDGNPKINKKEMDNLPGTEKLLLGLHRLQLCGDSGLPQGSAGNGQVLGMNEAFTGKPLEECRKEIEKNDMQSKEKTDNQETPVPGEQVDELLKDRPDKACSITLGTRFRIFLRDICTYILRGIKKVFGVEKPKENETNEKAKTIKPKGKDKDRGGRD